MQREIVRRVLERTDISCWIDGRATGRGRLGAKLSDSRNSTSCGSPTATNQSLGPNHHTLLVGYRCVFNDSKTFWGRLLTTTNSSVMCRQHPDLLDVRNRFRLASSSSSPRRPSVKAGKLLTQDKAACARQKQIDLIRGRPRTAVSRPSTNERPQRIKVVIRKAHRALLDQARDVRARLIVFAKHERGV